MGSGKSGLYRGTYGSGSINRNLTAAFKQEYGLKNGLFGIPGKNKGIYSPVRNIVSPTPVKTAKDFFTRLTAGGEERPISPSEMAGKGEMRIIIMGDGTTVTYRKYSSSADRSPAVDINISKKSNNGEIKKQKIHFVKGGKK